jgi:uncharacterized protein YndB with AHSA1/START domain
VETGTIEREIRIDAAPEVVYQVVSTPEHLRQWWSDEAERADGSETIRIAFGDSTAANRKSETLTVVEEDPPRRFSFRWVHDEGERAGSSRSLLVTFDLIPAGDGTLLRFSETGFREKGWEAAVLEKAYRDHENGWGAFLPRLVSYVDRLKVGA